MRMEAKNSYLKWVAQQGNFKNIALSVAWCHQILMCAFHQCEDFFDKTREKSNGMQLQLFLTLYVHFTGLAYIHIVEKLHL